MWARPFILYFLLLRWPARYYSIVGHGGEVRRYNGPDVDTIIAKRMRQAARNFAFRNFSFLNFRAIICHHRRSWSGPGTLSCRISYFMSYYSFRVAKFVIFLSFSPSSAIIGAFDPGLGPCRVGYRISFSYYFPPVWRYEFSTYSRSFFFCHKPPKVIWVTEKKSQENPLIWIKTPWHLSTKYCIVTLFYPFAAHRWVS
jgi:hypothetical protein